MGFLAPYLWLPELGELVDQGHLRFSRKPLLQDDNWQRPMCITIVTADYIDMWHHTQWNVSSTELPLTKPQVSEIIPTLPTWVCDREQSEWKDTAVNTLLSLPPPPRQALRRGQSKWGALKLPSMPFHYLKVFLLLWVLACTVISSFLPALPQTFI